MPFLKQKDLDFFRKISSLNTNSNMNIGILGGSFNPPHEGHMHISNEVIKKLKLHFLLWLITPLNPNKNEVDMLPFGERVSLCTKIINNHPKIKVNTFEESFSPNYTYDIINKLKSLSGNNNITWIMGEDNLLNIEKFNNWKKFIEENKIAICKRTEFSLASLTSLASFVYKGNQFSYINSGLNVNEEAKIKFLPINVSKVSSSQIREQNNTKQS